MTGLSESAVRDAPARVRFADASAQRRRNLAVLLGSIAVATVLSVAAHETDHPVTAANIFIVTVLLNGTLAGLAQGLTAAIAVSIIYDFFIRYPVYTRGFSVIDDMLPILALTTTAILSGAISGQLRSRVASTERARARLGKLLDYSRELHRAVSLEEIAQQLAAAIADRVALARCLARLASEHDFRDRQGWDEIVAGYLEASPPSGEEAPPATAELADEHAVVGLTKMAIERIELLEDTAAAEAAIRSDRLKSALISSLSHDLRTPLAAIAASATNLEQLGGSLAESERGRMIATIQQQCGRLTDFTTKLMSLGRLEGGLTSADLDVVDLEDAVDGALAAVRPIAAGRPILRRIEADGVFTRASPLLLEQALANVIENALRYGPEDGQVAVTLRRDGDRAVIAVTDQGPGIAPADQPHVFERFFRGGNAVGRPGHGLGLSIVKAFTDAMGGTIELISPLADGSGTELRIVLPALDIALDAEEPENG